MSANKVYLAANFASHMIRNGQYMGQALSIASRYYKVAYADVQRELAARGGSSKKRRKSAPKPIVICECCQIAEAIWRNDARRGYEKLASAYFCEQCRQLYPNGFTSAAQEHEITRRWVKYQSDKEV